MEIIRLLYLTLIALIMSAFPELEPPHLFLSLRVMFIMLINHFVLTVWLLKSSCNRQAKVLIGLIQAHRLMPAGHLGSSC